MVSLTPEEREALVGSIYDFLVEEGYHGHYPSAEEQAEKFVTHRLADDVHQIVAAHVAAALTKVAHQINVEMDLLDRTGRTSFATGCYRALRIVRAAIPPP